MSCARRSSWLTAAWVFALGIAAAAVACSIGAIDLVGKACPCPAPLTCVVGRGCEQSPSDGGAPPADASSGSDARLEDAHLGEGSPNDAGPQVVTIAKNVIGLGGLAAGQGMVFWTAGNSVYGARTPDASSSDAGQFVIFTSTPMSCDGPLVPDLGWSPNSLAFAVNQNGAQSQLFQCPLQAHCSSSSYLKGWGMSLALYVRATTQNVYAATEDTGIVNCAADCANKWTLIASKKDGPFEDLAMDLNSMYWITGSAVKSAPLSATADAGTAQVLSNEAAGGQGGIAVDADGFSWTTLDGHVWRCSLTGCGGSPHVIHAGPPGEQPTRIASNGTYLFWIQSGLGSLVSCPVDGCPDAGPRVIANGLTDPERIALSDGRVFIADWGADEVLSAPQ
jgi:hypothetical protein